MGDLGTFGACCGLLGDVVLLHVRLVGTRDRAGAGTELAGLDQASGALFAEFVFHGFKAHPAIALFGFAFDAAFDCGFALKVCRKRTGFPDEPLHQDVLFFFDCHVFGAPGVSFGGFRTVVQPVQKRLAGPSARGWGRDLLVDDGLLLTRTLKDRPLARWVGFRGWGGGVGLGLVGWGWGGVGFSGLGPLARASPGRQPPGSPAWSSRERAAHPSCERSVLERETALGGGGGIHENFLTFEIHENS